MTRKGRRMMLLGLGLAGVGLAAALTLSALDDNIVFFFSPSDLQAQEVPPGQSIRVGGLVLEGSVAHETGTALTRFAVTDGAETLSIEFVGALPALFREGQGVIAQGAMRADGVFAAREVLAKHDENYMPPEVADALKRAEHFRPGEAGG